MIAPFAPPNVGGAETHLENLCNYLSERDYRVTLLTYQPLTTKARGEPYEERKNLKIFRYWLYGNNLFHELEKHHPVFNFTYLTPLLFLKSFLFMLRHHREVDIVHVFGLSAAFIARFLKIFFRKPIVMSTETLYNFNTRSLFAVVSRWVLGGFDVILAQSEASKQDVMQVGFPAHKATVYLHWIDAERFKPRDKATLRNKLGWENKFTALYVGRLIPQKGVRVFLGAARRCQKDINFKVIGDDGPELEAVKRAAAELANLEFVGKVPYIQLPDYYAAADVFVYPALYREDMARVIIEALACGTPVVLSNRGSGAYEIDNRVGFVVRPEAMEVVDRVEYLYENPELIKVMSRECVEFAKKFSDGLGETITNTYDSLVSL